MSEKLDRLLATLFTDEQAHVIHARLWGGIAESHNKLDNGEPMGDCYKCRIIRDAVHDALRRFGEPR